MPLTALQAYNIEKSLIAGKKIEAIKLYREAMACDLVDAKAEIEQIALKLKTEKPWYFKGSSNAPASAETTKSGIQKRHLVLFFVIDALIFIPLIYYFFLRNEDATPTRQDRPTQKIQAEANTIGRPKAVSLPSAVDIESYSASLSPSDSFDTLYLSKLNNSAYIARKSSANSSSYDDSRAEKQIKSARSLLTQQRHLPANAAAITIVQSNSQPSLDGIIDDQEWGDATPMVIDKRFNTMLYFKTDGQWLFIACDTPSEKSQGGYDQLRVYLHAGLSDMFVNERIHIGKKAGVTSIRQTEFRWQGTPPKNDDERWKKYAISDWGIYRHAYGTSSMTSGHRQYEAAILLGEAGLHPGVPFTLYVEVETDPLKNAQGKFMERQYLGQFGDQHQPQWMMF